MVGEIVGLGNGLATALEIKFGQPGLDFADELRKVEDIKRLNAARNSLLSAASVEDLKKVTA